MRTGESENIAPDSQLAYDTLAKVYDDYIPDPDGFVDFYREFIGSTSNSVLYIGCGTGRLLEQLANQGNECIGLDPSPASIDRSAARLEHLTNATVYVDRLPEVATQNRKFDRIIIAGGAFEYILTTQDQIRALWRVKSLTRPQGSLALDVSAPPFTTSDLRGNYRGKYVSSNPNTTAELQSSEVRLGYDHFRQLVRSTCTFTFTSEEPPLVVQYLTKYTSLPEWRLLLAYTGYEANFYGDFHYGDVKRESSNYIIVGRCNQ